MHGMMDLMLRTLGPQIAIDLKIADRLPAAIVDPNQFELALLNLAVNSRDAMPDGGQLIIAISLETMKKDSEDLKSGEYIRVAVTDRGCGMAEATLQHAIEPFYSTKGVGKGTGSWPFHGLWACGAVGRHASIKEPPSGRNDCRTFASRHGKSCWRREGP